MVLYRIEFKRIDRDEWHYEEVVAEGSWEAIPEALSRLDDPEEWEDVDVAVIADPAPDPDAYVWPVF